MPSHPSPAIVPFIAYADGAAAIEFLVAGFGFVEQDRITNDRGRIEHATLALGDGLIYLAEFGDAYQGPKRHAETCDQARRWLDTSYIVDGAFVLVDDVRKHYEQAKGAGATILSDIEEGGVGTLYRAADPEGHRWMFCNR
jgi:uncharacterized glyoxalase superfamily protein PhnB